MMTSGENLRRTVFFEDPEWIPMEFHINPACWHHYPPGFLQELMADHPFLFPDFSSKEKINPQFSPVQRKDEPYTDPWGCVWETTDNGITGTVTKHPLADWKAFDSFLPPDLEKSDGCCPVNWQEEEERLHSAKEKGEMPRAELRHGHTFLQVCDIRGYENVIIDMADGEPLFSKLLKMIEEFNCSVVDRWISLGAEMLGFPEDLGMQFGPMLSPDHFDKYIKPMYTRMVAKAKKAGCIIHMHSDGDIRTLMKSLKECGMDVFNLQDLVNSVDWIAENLGGSVCVDLDIDRQSITPYGTPKEIDALIREEVKKIGSSKGGLMMIYGLYPGVPLENAKAVMDAMETYAGFFH